MSLRSQLRRIVRHGALTVAGSLSRPSPAPRLRFLYGHHLRAEDLSAFGHILSYLEQVGAFVTTAQAVAMVKGEAEITSPVFHLSFDDALSSAVRHAAPMLRDRGIPAIMFVPTRLVRAEGPEDGFAGWRDLEAAAELGLELGSHTRTHARLSEISASASRLQDEIEGSKEDLESRLGRACDYFSWPFGRESDVDDVGLEAVRRAGYRACFGAFRAPVSPGVTDPFRIPRHHFEPDWPLSHIKFFAHGGLERRTR